MISSPLLPSQKACKTNASKELKIAVVFAFVNNYLMKNHNHLNHITAMNATNLHHERKQIVTLNI